MFARSPACSLAAYIYASNYYFYPFRNYARDTLVRCLHKHRTSSRNRKGVRRFFPGRHFARRRVVLIAKNQISKRCGKGLPNYIYSSLWNLHDVRDRSAREKTSHPGAITRSFMVCRSGVSHRDGRGFMETPNPYRIIQSAWAKGVWPK